MTLGPRWIVRGALLVIALYLAVLAVHGPRHHQEVFPFFSWQLFSRVPPAESTSWSIRLLEVNGERLAEPVYFEEAADYVALSKSGDAYLVMQTWGRRLDNNYLALAEESRHILETRFLQDLDSVTYELVRRTYDVLDRVTCQCFVDEIVIGEFSLP